MKYLPPKVKPNRYAELQTQVEAERIKLVYENLEADWTDHIKPKRYENQLSELMEKDVEDDEDSQQ